MKTPCISSGRSETRTETSCHPSSSAISELSPARARVSMRRKSPRSGTAEPRPLFGSGPRTPDRARDGTESRVGFRHDGAQNPVHPLTPLRQFLSAEWLLHRFGTDLQRRGFRRHEFSGVSLFYVGFAFRGWV